MYIRTVMKNFQIKFRINMQYICFDSTSQEKKSETFSWRCIVKNEK